MHTYRLSNYISLTVVCREKFFLCHRSVSFSISCPSGHGESFFAVGLLVESIMSPLYLKICKDVVGIARGTPFERFEWEAKE
ncbi:hypothetical protein MANES_14G012610v8 [Manihot esculenta]|uniref:Uncharacterized protein n=1 Tax=Manihot esculenta TaxID=3983 RepID=A0ACB7GDZ0_MANES|nr:hypothetical protein MANES_14G012610v8 [Manihot esculenta]